MPKINVTVELTDDQLRSMQCIIDANQSFKNNSNGPLDRTELVTMLLSDVAAAVLRPGSWEGANMANLLQSHGYITDIDDID